MRDIIKLLYGQDVTPGALDSIFDLLPYPFLISRRIDGLWRHTFVNSQFTAELGYTLSDIPTIEEWFQKAYPDLKYREEVRVEWDARVKVMEERGEKKVVMRVVAQTASGPQWYEVTSTIFQDLTIVAFINIHEVKTHELKLEQENLNKDKILSILSHDLRGPIANLVSLTKLFEQEHFSTEELNKVMMIISQDVSHTFDLLETILTWTKSNFNKLETNRKQINLRGLILSVLDLVKGDLKNKNLEIESVVSSDYIHTDSGILNIVIRNLISNAIKFSLPGGKIIIRTETHGTEIWIRVQDFGTGMSAEAIGFITTDQPFTTAGTFREQGFGLGLRLCREFLPLINGALDIDSKNGQGTIMTIRLPLSQTPFPGAIA